MNLQGELYTLFAARGAALETLFMIPLIPKLRVKKGSAIVTAYCKTTPEKESANEIFPNPGISGQEKLARSPPISQCAKASSPI